MTKTCDYELTLAADGGRRGCNIPEGIYDPRLYCEPPLKNNLVDLDGSFEQVV